MIIIPDIHGRDFWKKAVEGKEDEEIIFLGDYMDPYDFEGIEYEDAIQNFKDIIEFANSHLKNVVLLLGNHDMHYLFNGIINKGSRLDYLHMPDIIAVFNEYKGAFRMAYEKTINGKRIIFSHAGISKKWLEYHEITLKGWTEENIVDWVNNALEVKDGRFLLALNDISHYRWGFHEFGSMIWADVREHAGEKSSLIGDFSIFGHTQLKDTPAVTKKYADLDCRRAFLLNDEGEILEINGEKVDIFQ